VFANWDQDETARTMAYADQDPGTVGTELTAAAQRSADVVHHAHDIGA